MSKPSSVIRTVKGLGIKASCSHRHPAWSSPTSSAENAGSLQVLNSLTETLVPFIPLRARKVTWYTCGPTVYDSAHMGHARAYLTFDILRRVMQDYFQYDVLYQMNITDIDDKIIKRARMTKLFQDYKIKILEMTAEKHAHVKENIQMSLKYAQESMDAKLKALQESLPADATTRMKEEREEKIKELTLKNEMLQANTKKIQDLLQAKAEECNLNELLDASRDVLSEWLDFHHGHEVSDRTVFEKHARRYEMEFWEDMNMLGVRSPDVITRVTEYVPQIISYIQKIIQEGFAYIANSSVYFDLNAYENAGHAYPKLKPVQSAMDRCATTAEMAEGEGVLAQDGANSATNNACGDGQKKNPSDFALWKFSKQGEPSWESPWGPGRPGWHIECSAMGSDVLGENMDIHAGGCDLKFPHHDNEIAQAEAYWGHDQWVNYFLHAGHLHIRGLKMAKSMKNFITIREALQEHTAMELRMMFLLQQWFKPMNYSDQTVGEAKERIRTFRSFFSNVQHLERGQQYLNREQPWDSAIEGPFAEVIAQMKQEVHQALCDNFNTPAAIEALLKVVAETHKYLGCEGRSVSPNVPLLKKASREVTAILEIFGIQLNGSGSDSSEASSFNASAQDNIIQTLVSFRDRLRNEVRTWPSENKNRILKMCDALRDDDLPQVGIRLEDATSSEIPTKWSKESPELLLREIQQRKEATRLAAVQKLEQKLKQKRIEMEKWQEVARCEDPKAEVYHQVKLFSEWGADGLPLKNVDGSEVSKSALKKLEKEYKKLSSLHTELATKGGLAYLTVLQNDIVALEQECATISKSAS